MLNVLRIVKSKDRYGNSQSVRLIEYFFGKEFHSQTLEGLIFIENPAGASIASKPLKCKR